MNYHVKAVQLKSSETGKPVGFTPAIFNDDGFVENSAYYGITMGRDAPLYATEEIAMQRYNSAKENYMGPGLTYGGHLKIYRPKEGGGG